ncbi:MAG: hypothetical protein KF819_34150 [Labilithrix sp.]|nr:hypothetical protein [Labilithrix sp.]
MRSLIKLSLGACLLGALGAVGCSIAQEEDTGRSPDEVVAGGDVSQILKSTLFLEAGCTAAKVGPKHLLIAARCIAANPVMFEEGKILKFASAASGRNTIAAESTSDAGAGPSDAGAPRDGGDGGREGGASNSGNTTARDATIAAVSIHPSFAAKCKTDLCGFNTLEASDAPDIAVILLAEDLDTVPTVPVDLDPVNAADPVFAVNSGCETLEARITAPAKASRTIAVPPKSVNHAGSPYRASPQLVSRLGSSYVVTPGPGWRATEPKLCKADIGAPLFRAGSAAVAGVTSNFTAASGTRPVTTHHTRVDEASRFKIGDWLTELGVETVHSCSETAGGCVKRAYDGGAPDIDPPGTTEPASDGGAEGDAIAPETDGGEEPTEPEEPTGPRQEQLPGEDPTADDYYADDEVDYSDAAAPKKKKKKADEGCSAAPGPMPTGNLALAAGVAIAAALVRRRRK